jgi:hypothetical protein
LRGKCKVKKQSVNRKFYFFENKRGEQNFIWGILSVGSLQQAVCSQLLTANSPLFTVYLGARAGFPLIRL